jgi:hypothetical protein
VAKVVCIDPPADGRGQASIGILPSAYVLLVSLPVLYFGINPEALMELVKAASQQVLG